MVGPDANATSPASDGKAPRTPRGERTLRKILDAALEEFGEKGFSEGSIVGITGRARVALGTFYTYFDSKEAVFQELVRDMAGRSASEMSRLKPIGFTTWYMPFPICPAIDTSTWLSPGFA